ncbi:MAG: hypothetical protein ACTH4Y_11365 [Microbacterium gubbeenense]|uniref:hypothetical protein n=1 Tax=Microbacterium gubbeenense TaxID=159896 RepID=UPI003F982BF3
MAVVAYIDLERVELADYSVEIASTPVDVADSSGHVGTLSATLPAYMSFTDALSLRDKPIVIDDDIRGQVNGVVDDVSRSRESGLLQLSGTTTLRRFNIYNVSADPFSGTLRGALDYYAGLAGTTLIKTSVSESLLNTKVAFIAWTGELWHHLKMLTAAYGLEIVMSNSLPAVREIRSRNARFLGHTSQTAAISREPVAQSVEVYHYETHPLSTEMIYPAGEWTEELEVFSVEAGDTTEVTVEVPFSLVSVQQPAYRASIGPNYSGGSAYTAVGNDGLPITPAAWKDKGGELTALVNEDRQSLTLVIKGPAGLPDKDGGELTSFDIAMASGESERYAALYLRGTGVRFEKILHTFDTGIDPSRAESEVGETIDNPFLTSLNRTRSAGVRAANHYSGHSFSLNGAVAHFSPEWEAEPYDLFGYAGGLRVWDEDSRLWYRLRNVNFTPSSATFSGDDDLTLGDLDEHFASKTLGEIDSIYAGMTLEERFMKGLIDD